MRTRAWGIVAIGLLVVGGGVACSGADDDSASEASGAEGAEAPADGDGEATAEGQGGLPTGDPIQAGRSIIASAEVNLEVDDVRTAAHQATDAAVAAGGFLAQQDANPTDGVASLTLRVPTERFQSVMSELEAIGTVLVQRVDTEDVTEQVVDLESRITSARSSVGRVRDLLDESGDVTQLAAVEGELSRRETELETLLGRQRMLDDEVSLATIAVHLREAAVEAVEAPEEEESLPGFFGGLRSGWRGFVTAASVVGTVLGYALPFLVLGGLVSAAWFGGQRRRRRGPVAAD